MNAQFHRRREGGFTLVEALVALLVMAFGMLAIAGFQLSLSKNSDLAKQRSEATRLAQQKVDELRAFQQKAASAPLITYEGSVISGGPEQIAPAGYSNATFTREWFVTTSTGDFFRWLRVAVSWPDRSGVTQTVTLHSVISNGEPGDVNLLAVGPGGSNTLKPKNRNINIPYPAVTLSGGTQSAFQPPPGTAFFVFNNDTGNVMQRCTGSLPAEGGSLDPSTCTVFSSARYLLSGFVRFKTSGASPTASNIENTTDTTMALLPTVIGSSSPLAIDSSVTGHGPSNIECYSQRQKVMGLGTTSLATVATAARSSNVVTITTTNPHGFTTGLQVIVSGVANSSFNGTFTVASTPNSSTFTFAQTGSAASSSGGEAGLVQEITVAEGATFPAAYNSLKSTFVAYACVLEPVDDDSNSATKPAWWGQLNLNPSGWTIAPGSGNFKVCRFSADYNGNGRIANAEHPRYYRRVTGALDNQNFLVINGNDNCPSDVAADPLGNDFVNTNTVDHQPSANASALEPASATEAIDME